MKLFNGFKFRDKAVRLYKQGKDINQIQKEVGIIIELGTVEKWIEEDEKYKQTKDYIKQSIKIKKQIKKAKTKEELESLYFNLQEVVKKILDINPENMVAKKDFILASSYIKKVQRNKIKSQPLNINEMQEQFAKEQLAKENAFTVEKQEEYIDSINTKFQNGEIKKENLKEIWKNLERYPDRTRSIIFILDLYAKITEYYIIPVKALEVYADKTYTLTPEEYDNVLNEISKYRKHIAIQEYAKEKDKKMQSLKEQKDYSKEIIEKLKNGEISKEEMPKIIEKLEEFPDKVRSTFLISKLYEILYDKKEALSKLANYAKKNNLDEQEKSLLVQMQDVLSKRDSKLNTTTSRLRKIYKVKENEEKVYKKKVQKDAIINYILDGKTVLEISEIMKENGTSIKTISKIRKSYIQKNETLRTENIKLEGIVRKLLQSGFSSNQVHKLVEYDVSMPTIEEIKAEMENKKENDTENVK